MRLVHLMLKEWLKSEYLEAFEAVARNGSILRAASVLGLSQPALSRRLQGLEEKLSVSLFLRERSGTVLTEAGRMLLRHCDSRIALENDFLGELKSLTSADLNGILRIGGYSYILRQLVLPRLEPLVTKHPKVSLQFFAGQAMTKENQLKALMRGELDFLVDCDRRDHADVRCEEMGSDELILCESGSSVGDAFLDTRPEDDTSEKFLRKHRQAAPKKRHFLFDEDSIVEAACLGLGRAVIYRSIARKHSELKLVRGYNAVPVKFFLHFRKQRFYSQLENEARRHLLRIENQLSKF